MVQQFFKTNQAGQVLNDLTGGRIINYEYNYEYVNLDQTKILLCFHTVIFENGYHVNLRYSDVDEIFDFFASTSHTQKLFHLGLYNQKTFWKLIQLINEISLLEPCRDSDQLYEIEHREQEELKNPLLSRYDFSNYFIK